MPAKRYKLKKHYVWGHDLAYLAGLIAADGCLLNDRRHINITSKDIDQLETVRSVLGLKSKIKSKRNGFGGISYYVGFSDVALYDFLLVAGITPSKSKTIQQIIITDEFYPDLLRGYFDGDGTVYGYKDSRWASSYMYYCGFVSASSSFLEWIQLTNSRLVGTGLGQIKPGVRAKTLTYAKADSQKLFDFMYYDAKIPYLERKRTKFVDFLRQDPYASMALQARVLELVDRPR